MTPETQKRLQPLLDQLVDHFCRICGANSYEEAIAALRQKLFRNKETSPAAWFHKIARETYPTSEPDTVQPEYFYEILGLIDTRDRWNSVFAGLPEDSTPEIERFLKFILKVFLPSQKSAAQELANNLPQRRSGGPHSKMPSPEKCREICDWISGLKGVSMGDRQRRAVARFGPTFRMIQTIWSKWKP